MKKFNNLSRNIFIALIAGATIGILWPNTAPYVSFLGLIFKLSLAMIVMPVVLTSILCGLESVGDISRLSGMGIKTMTYYLATTFIAVGIGLFMVSVIKPGIKEPASDVKSAILEAQGEDAPQLISAIASALVQISALEKNSSSYIDFQESLNSLAKTGVSLDEIRSSALNLVGSLEIRATLNKDNRPKQIDAMPAQKFVNEQLRHALVNPFEALVNKNVLAIIVFMLLFGCAMTTIGPLGAKFFEINRAANLAVMKVVEFIMGFAPIGVFALIIEVCANTGSQVFSSLGYYALCVILGLLVHFFVVLSSFNYFYARITPWQFFKRMRPALTVAFSTSSSSATLPVTMQTVEDNLGVDKRVSQFMLPLGASVNMDGTALYEAVAAVFIAQLYGVSLGLQSQIIVAVMAALASMGSAGIPAAGTVTMAMVLSAVGLPIEAIGILLAVDRPLDMCRTAINVASDATGCVVLNSIEKKRVLKSYRLSEDLIV